MRPEFNELILTAEKNKKKGGSLAATTKLIQELTEFEEKIQECVDAQEISENKEKIEAFLKDIDKMYEVLMEMTKNTIQSLRQQRMLPHEEVVEETEEVVTPDELVVEDEPVAVSRPPVQLSVPKVPRM